MSEIVRKFKPYSFFLYKFPADFGLSVKNELQKTFNDLRKIYRVEYRKGHNFCFETCMLWKF